MFTVIEVKRSSPHAVANVPIRVTRPRPQREVVAESLIACPGERVRAWDR